MARLIMLHMFPIGYWSGYDSKQRMRCGKWNFMVLAVNRGAAQTQFSEKPAPFVLQLAIGDEDAVRGSDRTELGAIKGVVT